MFAVCMLCSGSIYDVVVGPNEAEGEGDDSGKDEREDHGGNEGL